MGFGSRRRWFTIKRTIRLLDFRWKTRRRREIIPKRPIVRKFIYKRIDMKHARAQRQLQTSMATVRCWCNVCACLNSAWNIDRIEHKKRPQLRRYYGIWSIQTYFTASSSHTHATASFLPQRKIKMTSPNPDNNGGDEEKLNETKCDSIWPLAGLWMRSA